MTTATAPSPVPTGVSLDQARAAGAKVIRRLRAACGVTLAHVAGSVRRGNDRCRDLDIIVCPPRLTDFWNRKLWQWDTRFFSGLLNGGVTPRSSSTATGPIGPLWRVEGQVLSDSKQITLHSLKGQGFKVELWPTVSEHMGWLLMIRTGPRELGQGLMRLAKARGFHPRVQLLSRQGKAGLTPVYTPTERSVFEVLDIPWYPTDSTSRERLARHMHEIADDAGIGREDEEVSQ